MLSMMSSMSRALRLISLTSMLASDVTLDALGKPQTRAQPQLDHCRSGQQENPSLLEGPIHGLARDGRDALLCRRKSVVRMDGSGNVIGSGLDQFVAHGVAHQSR